MPTPSTSISAERMLEPHTSLALLAASGLAREVLSAVSGTRDQRVSAIYDDDESLWGSRIHGVPVLGPIAQAADQDDALVICAGSGSARMAIAARLTALGVTDDRYGRVLHPTSLVPPGCYVGAGSILLGHVVLTADVSIGRHVVAMPHVVLTHDDEVSDYATLCAGVVLGGGVRIGRAAYVGMKAAVRQNLRVGEDSVLGMGSVLLEDLPAAQTWAGVPASLLAPPTKSTGLQPPQMPYETHPDLIGHSS